MITVLAFEGLLYSKFYCTQFPYIMTFNSYNDPVKRVPLPYFTHEGLQLRCELNLDIPT